MTLAVPEFLLGLFVTGLALIDFFSTLLVPGRNRGALRAAKRVHQIGLPISRRFSGNTVSPGSRPSNSFAPLMFVLVAGSWLLLLLFGFGLMFHALAGRFTPPLDRFDQALYVAGSSLLTLGVTEVDANGGARWLILAAAASGFGVITVAVSFVLQVQSALQRREPRVLALATVAGTPPSGLAALETFAQLGAPAELRRFFMDWRDWSADLLQSHSTFPSLVFFHSLDARSDWLASLEAVLDAATMLMAFTEHEASGAATLLHRMGSRAAAQLCDLFELSPNEADDARGDPAEVTARLAAAGYRLKADEAEAAAYWAKLQTDYAGRIRIFAEHLGAARSRPAPPHFEKPKQ